MKRIQIPHVFRRPLAALLTGALLLGACRLPVSAAHVTAREAVEQLTLLGLAEGAGDGFEPERGATRAEATVLLLRLLGLTEAAEDAALPSRFTDGGWADPYLSYAAEAGLVAGLEDGSFGADRPVSARDFVTMVLRALDYREWRDFFWADSLAFADEIGLTHGEYGGLRLADQFLYHLPEPEFLREDMALVAYTALTLKPKGSDLRLIDRLYADGAVSAESLERSRFANAVNAGRQALTPGEIYERSASAVLRTRLYADADELERDDPSYNGSAFLVSPDGVALMCYHELEDCAYATAAMSDGRVFDVAEVLAYDAPWDYAVVRLSRTDRDGNAAHFFPWLDLGDSDALSPGDPVYVVSAPRKLAGTVATGLVSQPHRVVDDPDYPVIQASVPVSDGSSGGPLLNAYGEAVGILFAAYSNSENISFAVPSNVVRPLVEAGGGGPAISEVLETETAKKLAATLEADRTELTLRPGETGTVTVRHSYHGNLRMYYDVGNPKSIRCGWGSFLTKQSVELHITALEPGKSVLDVRFSDGGDPDTTLRLTVTVAGPDPAPVQD